MTTTEPTIHFTTVILERTPCLGTCPVYHIEIQLDGTVRYEGIVHVKTTGHRAWTIPPEAVKKINEAIHRYTFFDLEENKNVPNSTDMSSCITTILLSDGRQRTIENSYGTDRYPPSLFKLENTIDRLSGALRFVLGRDEPEMPAMSQRQE